MLSNRVGKFSLSKAFIKDSPDVCMQIMGKVIVLRAEYMWNDTVEYVAISNEFRELKEGETPPYYKACVYYRDSKLTIKFEERK